jgi:hypothetical protein|nr:MAG TPA: hypothetical protein [Caudoviricetes sp.]
MKQNDQKIIVIHETIIESIIKDAVTFLMFASLLYFNHKVLAGSTVVDALFIFMVIAFIQAKGSKKFCFCTPKEAIKFLKEQYDD